MNTIIFVVVSLALINQAYGFVDGNNNGRDDVQEWEDSSAYRLQAPYIEMDKQNRHLQCDIFHGNWNNTGDGSCIFTKGKDTCFQPTNGSIKCTPMEKIK